MTDEDVEHWKLNCPKCGFTSTKIRKTGMEYIAPGVHATSCRVGLSVLIFLLAARSSQKEFPLQPLTQSAV